MEVKTNEGVSSEAVIIKLTDASLYTVGESLRLTDRCLIEPEAVGWLIKVDRNRK